MIIDIIVVLVMGVIHPFTAPPGVFVCFGSPTDFSDTNWCGLEFPSKTLPANASKLMRFCSSFLKTQVTLCTLKIATFLPHHLLKDPACQRVWKSAWDFNPVHVILRNKRHWTQWNLSFEQGWVWSSSEASFPNQKQTVGRELQCLSVLIWSLNKSCTLFSYLIY